jgi:hypothetical protein
LLPRSPAPAELNTGRVDLLALLRSTSLDRVQHHLDQGDKHCPSPLDVIRGEPASPCPGTLQTGQHVTPACLGQPSLNLGKPLLRSPVGSGELVACHFAMGEESPETSQVSALSSPAGDFLTLREASDSGVIPWKYDAAKKRLQRKIGSVPASRGKNGNADLYARADLAQWAGSRTDGRISQ